MKKIIEELFSLLMFVAILLVIVLMMNHQSHAQLAPGENYVGACATRPACTLTPAGGVQWVNGNQVWIVPLMQGTGSVRIWIRNLNTTSAHTTQTITAFLTDDTNASSLLNQADRWLQAVVEQNSIAGASCNNVAINNPVGAPGVQGKGACYVSGMFGAQLAIQISGAVAAAGTPDAFELGIYQGLGYASGPQPGADSSSGGGPGVLLQQSAVNPSDAMSNNIFRLWNCLNAAGQQVNCALTTGLAALSGANWARVRMGNAASYPTAVGTGIASTNYLWPGAGAAAVVAEISQSQGNASLTSVLDSSQQGMAISVSPAVWSTTDQGTAKQCSASVAASATGKQHFITACTVCIAAGATAQTPIFANLRDGATGAGTIKWSSPMAAITNTPWCAQFSGFSEGTIAGTANTAATCELSAASNATVACSATIQGYDQ